MAKITLDHPTHGQFAGNANLIANMVEVTQHIKLSYMRAVMSEYTDCNRLELCIIAADAGYFDYATDCERRFSGVGK